MKRKKFEVTAESKLGEVINNYPQAGEVMLEYGLHCLGCFASQFETIEQGARIHGLSDQEIVEMVERINEIVNRKK